MSGTSKIYVYGTKDETNEAALEEAVLAFRQTSMGLYICTKNEINNKVGDAYTQEDVVTLIRFFR